MNKAWITVCCVLMLASVNASAEVYKWKDKNGKMQYSDTPPMSNIPYSTLSGKKAPVTPAPASNAEPNAQGAPSGAPKMGTPPNAAGKQGEPNPSKDKVSDDLKEKAAKEAEAKKQQEAEAKKQQEEKKAAEQKAKEQACKAARSKLAQFQQGGRIYRTNEQGEREYYGDKEIAAEIENAKSDVAANCE